MATKLYVGNLSYNATQEQLQALFSQVGEVSEIAIVTDRDTGRARGFGFVTMTTEADAQEAIKRFNGYNLDNRALTVNEARPREERSNSGGFGGGGQRRDNYSGGNRRNRY